MDYEPLFYESPFVSFVRKHEDTFLRLTRIFAASTPKAYNQPEYRSLIGEYMAQGLAQEFSSYPLSEGRLVADPSDGYDMLFQYHLEGSDVLHTRRISLKSMQSAEIFQRKFVNDVDKFTKAKSFVVKNRLGPGTGCLERNFDDLLLVQRYQKSSKKFAGLLYGVGCATFDKIREHCEVTNDQIKVSIDNVDWNYCSGVRSVPNFEDVSADADKLFAVALDLLHEGLFELGERAIGG